MALSYTNKKLQKIYYCLPSFLQRWATFLYSKKVERRRYGGIFSTQLDELIENESLSTEERLERQLNRLKEMLIYAGTSSPYYRAMFNKIGFDSRSVHSVNDIRGIPVLEKDDIRAHHDKLLVEQYKEAKMKHRTSGTTGSGLHFTLSEEANQIHYACLWFHFGWVDSHRGDPIATFGGHPVVPLNRLSPPFWMYDRNENDLMFSAYHISPKTAQAYVEALADFNPIIIRGYPSSIYLIALHILETGKQKISPKGIFTYSETTLAKQRQAIEEAFGCQVYSSYGTGERAGHLLQCEKRNFHEVTESSVIEVISPNGKPAKPGEIGELVITSLINKAMPMIRYQVGDTGVRAEGLCTCGRSSPIIRDITGRTTDVIVTPDGRHLRNLDQIFRHVSHIKEAQLVQEKIDEVTLYLVIQPNYDENVEKLVLQDFRSKLGDEMKIRLQFLDEIPRTSQGKYRFNVSKIPIQFGDSIQPTDEMP
jgi:phenylacetate-CoA ligase